jgi:hypothetical protein
MGLRLLMPHRSLLTAMLFAVLAFAGMVFYRAAAASGSPWVGPIEYRHHGSRRRESVMNTSSPTAILVAHLAVLSSIGFGGFPTVLPDIYDLATVNGWLNDREFLNLFAVSQITPGPNIILMMSFIGLKVGGIGGAIASALATFGPPCAMYYAGTGYGIGFAICRGRASCATRLLP